MKHLGHFLMISLNILSSFQYVLPMVDLYKHSERTTQPPYNLPTFVIAEHQVQTSTKMPLSM